MAITPEHRKKINTAISVCEKAFLEFSEDLLKAYGKAEAASLKNFLLQNTVFAGGVFRSVFTDTPINDIDVFFTSQDAALEFRHRMALNNKIFTPGLISPNFTYNYSKQDNKTVPKSYISSKPKTSNMLSFITNNAGDPTELIRRFDFTFNQHYFSLNTYAMFFDRDTFDKNGTICPGALSTKLVQRYARALRFLREGFKISDADMLKLAGEISGRDLLGELNEVGSSGDGLRLHRSITTGRYYGEDMYFRTAENRFAEPASPTVNPYAVAYVPYSQQRTSVGSISQPIPPAAPLRESDSWTTTNNILTVSSETTARFRTELSTPGTVQTVVDF